VHFPKDAGSWGLIVAVLGILLLYPMGLLINMTTPLVQSWMARRAKSSLENRIDRLQRNLAELEEKPAITEFEEMLLWHVKSTRILLYWAMTLTVGGIYVIVLLLEPAHPETLWVYAVNTGLLGAVLALVTSMLEERFQRDFWFKRSPRIREGLRNQIADLKKILEGWR
jgi:hypothetical protein